MKKLLLLRHGNAAPTQRNGSDHDRPLDKSGRAQIASIADKLVNRNHIPEMIICSSALRAITSAEIAAGIVQCSVQITETLYSAAYHEYINLLRRMKDRVNSVMIVAHNPTISEFGGKLAGKHLGMGTGNLCLLELDIEQWKNLDLSSPVISSTIIRP